MINLLLYIQLLKILIYIVVQDDTVYVDARWYVKCIQLNKWKWNLDKYIYNATHCKYFKYTFITQNNEPSECKWEWNEQEQRYK